MEYQWNINQTENMLEMGSPHGGRTGAAKGRGAGGGIAPTTPVQGSGERQ